MKECEEMEHLEWNICLVTFASIFFLSIISPWIWDLCTASILWS